MNRETTLTPAADVIGELYATHARRLRAIVGATVRAPEPVIEDACAVAWARFIPRARTVAREATFSWLVTTASREAMKLARRDQRDLSLESLLEDEVDLPEGESADDLVARRERLAEVGRLPVRQQQLVWLAGLGFSYEEMAARTRCTRRTVERQLLRAKHILEAAA